MNKHLFVFCSFKFHIEYYFYGALDGLNSQTRTHIHPNTVHTTHIDKYMYECTHNALMVKDTSSPLIESPRCR